MFRNACMLRNHRPHSCDVGCGESASPVASGRRAVRARLGCARPIASEKLFKLSYDTLETRVQLDSRAYVNTRLLRVGRHENGVSLLPSLCRRTGCENTHRQFPQRAEPFLWGGCTMPRHSCLAQQVHRREAEGIRVDCSLCSLRSLPHGRSPHVVECHPRELRYSRPVFLPRRTRLTTRGEATHRTILKYNTVTRRRWAQCLGTTPSGEGRQFPTAKPNLPAPFRVLGSTACRG